MFADIAFPISRYQTFTYKIPPHLIKELKIGSRVRAPLKRRDSQGIVIDILEKPRFSGNIFELTDLVDTVPVLDHALWKLIQWMSDYYLTPIGKVALTVLPKALSTKYKPPQRFFVKYNSSADDSLNKNAHAQAEIITFLKQNQEWVPVSILAEFIPSPLVKCRALHKKGLVCLEARYLQPDTTEFLLPPVHKKIDFSQEQAALIQKMALSLESERFEPVLLHGVTGSGKTEIYLEMVHRTLSRGKTAILLLPEIALTPQIAGRFRSVFGEQVALWHSKMSNSSRAWTWKQICLGAYKVVIGARSAVFTPLKNLGLIVIDEEQESAYKQEAPIPKYHARDVALMRGKLTNSLVIMASATPSLESYYNHTVGKYTYHHLSKRFGGAVYPIVHVVDMGKEQEEAGKYGQIFSGLLLEKMEKKLELGEQIILMHNRRGHSPILKCTDCGEMIMCPHCQVTLTYHRHGNNLQCHVCGYIQPGMLKECPHCRGIELKLFGTGTQKIEDLVTEIFPEARIARLDMDTTRKGTNLTATLHKFAQQKLDILIGTQMIAKGLDFDNTTLVGIINGDTGLFLPDFRAGERIFQLIYQAAGRAGRRKKPGEVVVQTYHPSDSVIKHACKLDIKKYYNIALSERGELNYPPFSWIIKIEFMSKDRDKLEKIMQSDWSKIRGKNKSLEILGPVFCYREKIRRHYRLQMVFKSSKKIDPNGFQLHRFIRNTFGRAIFNRLPTGVTAQIDVDPASLL